MSKTYLMIGVITGDVINSKKTDPSVWLLTLKNALGLWGATPKQWEMYRGDSFQLEIINVSEALKASIQIKSAMKSLKGLDVRMAIGIGGKSHVADKVSESNGSAFVNSGELAEQLKKFRLNLAIRSNHSGFDREINLYLKFASVIMDKWSDTAAETVFIALQNPGLPQEELGKLLGNIKQNAVSTRLKRAHYDEINELLQMYREKISNLK
jgi:hypothetical protein